MKKLALLLAVACTAGFASAQDTAAPASPAPKPVTKAPAKAHSSAMKSHELSAEVVSVDATAKTLTIKGDTENKTLPVDSKAVAAVKDLKAGQKVTLLCRDDAKGNHVAVTGVKAEAKTDAKTETKSDSKTMTKAPAANPSPAPKK